MADLDHKTRTLSSAPTVVNIHTRFSTPFSATRAPVSISIAIFTFLLLLAIAPKNMQATVRVTHSIKDAHQNVGNRVGTNLAN